MKILRHKILLHEHFHICDFLLLLPDVGMMTQDKTDTSVLDECTLAGTTDTETTIAQLYMVT